ncbi:enoyl-CoA hydratase-related protein [Rhizobium ruizarguesonis]|jgi:crotonobetainyl-CoA hydratase|uniref:enoyl-CoA hydratase-related protein n=1 Tax=Rhizobium ruizarguesonis TaxID=2081791 RepID=UPI00102FE84B|nr:enoyl-CoA hydratase-related protein [Rhizobium ruizarguesonis]MBY5886140.1 crotonase [Rhizobium leguminosarum]NEJ00249.1 crotonase [Rhizobium ruizarguesonis]NEJ37561.1 crotonase [Rhizobium ruizarguesonis]QSZ04480.1 enoyl-CoA hydratase/isomerase family protein [Rhizobium ruizarguesonis]TAW62389.1 crotonase [Rhizobium ruizarguesonis]
MSVGFSVGDRVARVTLDRADRMNAVDAATEQELETIWREIEARDDISCVVLTGAGERAFCAGADLKGGSGSSGLDYWAASRVNGFGGLAFRRSLDVPVIARVNGFALGGGFEMVLGCDIVIAAETARFGLPEARVGRMPLDGGMVLLQRKIAFNRAMAVMLTGRQFSAAEMAGFGVVNEVVPAAELDAAVDRWVADIVACAPLSLRAIKQTVNRTGHLSPAEAQALRTPALVKALQSEDALEGVAAFQQKRAPVWRGR